MDVMFYEVFEEEAKLIKELLPTGIEAQCTWKTIQENGDEIPPARLISVRTQSLIPLSWAHQLDGILSRSQGFDHLLKYRRESGANIACGYLGTYCSRAVAEHAIMMMMVLLRKTKLQMKNFQNFTRDHITGSECQSRNALVVGVGNIGSQIVDMAQGLKMNVKGVDIEPRLKTIDYVSLSDGLSWADMIFCALPLSEQTRGMLNYEALKKAPKGFILINIARGEIIPTQDIKKLLDENLMGALGADVFEKEQDLANSLRGSPGEKSEETKIVQNLTERDNVLFTPHNAFNTEESVRQKASLSVAAVKEFLKKKTFPVSVD